MVFPGALASPCHNCVLYLSTVVRHQARKSLSEEGNADGTDGMPRKASPKPVKEVKEGKRFALKARPFHAPFEALYCHPPARMMTEC